MHYIDDIVIPFFSPNIVLTLFHFHLNVKTTRSIYSLYVNFFEQICMSSRSIIENPVESLILPSADCRFVQLKSFS